MPLTADLIAVAIVAAARSYGDDPVRAFMARGGPKRRSLTPAAEALAFLTQVPITRLSPMLKIAPRGCARARVNGGPGYMQAFARAEAAIRAALAGSDQVEVAAPAPAPASPAADEELVETGGCAPPIVVRRADPPPEPPRRAPGPLTSWISPAPGLPTLPEAERPLGDRILDVLADGSATPMGLASILGVKESLVSQSLSVLRHAGVITADPPPREGLRQQRHRLLSTQAAQAAVLAVLRGEPMTGPDIMAAACLAEGEVRAALNELADAGEVVRGPRTKEGWSAQYWRRAAGEEAA